MTNEEEAVTESLSYSPNTADTFYSFFSSHNIDSNHNTSTKQQKHNFSYIYAFNSIDPKADEFPQYSPYSYCQGDPINKIDPDGRKVIFVNGFLRFGSPKGGASYWNGENSNFVKGAKSYFHDNDVVFLNIDHEMSSSAISRISKGYDFAQKFFDELTSTLGENETLKFVSHSMGAAFAEGMARYFILHGINVSEIVHLNPFQANDITTVNPTNNLTKTTDYQNTDDPVINKIPFVSAPGNINGADYIIREPTGEPDIFLKHRYPILMGNGKGFWQTLRDKQLNSSFIDSPIFKFQNP